MSRRLEGRLISLEAAGSNRDTARNSGLMPEGAAWHSGDRDPNLIMRTLGLTHLDHAFMNMAEPATPQRTRLVHRPSLRIGMTPEYYAFLGETSRLSTSGRAWGFTWIRGGEGSTIQAWQAPFMASFICNGGDGDEAA